MTEREHGRERKRMRGREREEEEGRERMRENESMYVCEGKCEIEKNEGGGDKEE